MYNTRDHLDTFNDLDTHLDLDKMPSKLTLSGSWMMDISQRVKDYLVLELHSESPYQIELLLHASIQFQEQVMPSKDIVHRTSGYALAPFLVEISQDVLLDSFNNSFNCKY